MWLNLDAELLDRLPRKPANGPTHSDSAWAAVASQLDRYQAENTEDDWDGQGADAIPLDVIESARCLAMVLDARGVAAPGWAVPTYTPSVSFEWELPDGVTLEIDVVAAMTLRVIRLTPGQRGEQWTVTDSVAVA